MIWKRHPRFKSYAVSTDGEVKSLRTGLILTPWRVATGYLRVELYRNGKFSSEYVHRIVAETFLHRPIGMTEVNHLNGVKSDNRLENLEWTDRKGNMEHYSRNYKRNLKIYELVDLETGKTKQFKTQKAIAKSLGVSPDTVKYILAKTVSQPKGKLVRRIV